MKKLVLSLFAVTLCGCPATPNVLKTENGNERQLTCDQLVIAMQDANRAKKEAHDNDKFEFRHIIPTTGIASVYNIWQADSHAVARIEFLDKVSKEKGCNNSYSSKAGEIILAQSQPPAGTTAQTPPVQTQATPEGPKAAEEEDPRTRDQDTSVYIKNGYDAEVFPRRDPKHFTF